MTAFLNRWTGIGNAVDDPYGGNTDSGSQWAYFKIACDRPYVGEDEIKADFIPVMCIGDVAHQVLQYLKKGRFIYVEGRLQVKNYEGEWRMEVEADFIRMLDQPGQASSQASQRHYDARQKNHRYSNSRKSYQSPAHYEPPIEQPQYEPPYHQPQGRKLASRSSSGDRRTARYDGFMPRR